MILLAEQFCLFPVCLTVPLVLGPKRRQCSPLCGGLDSHGDHPLLFLHLQPAQPSALPHQMGKVKLLRVYCLALFGRKLHILFFKYSQVHVFFRAVPHGSDRGTFDHLRRVAIRAETGLYSITLPNKYNFSFDYHSFLILVMVSYIPSTF